MEIEWIYLLFLRLTVRRKFRKPKNFWLSWTKMVGSDFCPLLKDSYFAPTRQWFHSRRSAGLFILSHVVVWKS